MSFQIRTEEPAGLGHQVFSKYEPRLLAGMAQIVLKDLQEGGAKSKELIERMNREKGFKPNETVSMLTQYANQT